MAPTKCVNKLNNLQCEAAKVLTRTVESLMNESSIKKFPLIKHKNLDPLNSLYKVFTRVVMALEKQFVYPEGTNNFNSCLKILLLTDNKKLLYSNMAVFLPSHLSFAQSQ
jgi:hypothetical protein